MNIEQYFLNENKSVRAALEVLEKNLIKIVLVTDDNDKLVGTITDGDVRRAMMRGHSFDAPARTIMATHPVTMSASSTKEQIIETMGQRRVEQMILTDDDGKVVSIKSIDSINKPERKENWVVLMAGGLGTRLHPLTQDTPKPMLTVGGSPILEILITHFKKLGFYKFYICVNYKAEMIQDYFADGTRHGVNIRYIQEEEKLDTAGALSLIAEKPDLPLFVVNGDIVTSLNFEEMLDFHITHRAAATMAIYEHSHQIPYGVVTLNDYEIHSFVEKPVHKHFINAGIYLINPELLSLLVKDKPCTMPDLFQRAKDSKKLTIGFPIREYWLDIGRPEDYDRANNDNVIIELYPER